MFFYREAEPPGEVGDSQEGSTGGALPASGVERVLGGGWEGCPGEGRGVEPCLFVMIKYKTYCIMLSAFS